jgi:ribonucleoside-diphosphate reductase alpha chain
VSEIVRDCTREVIALYDVIARLASLALQYGVPIEEVGEMLRGPKFEPAGPVQGHPRIKNCSSLCDLIGRHLLVEYASRDDLAHVPATE